MMERRAIPRPRAFDLGDPRTPMAWQHRNYNFQQEHQIHHHHQQMQLHQQAAYSDRYQGSSPVPVPANDLLYSAYPVAIGTGADGSLEQAPLDELLGGQPPHGAPGVNAIAPRHPGHRVPRSRSQSQSRGPRAASHQLQHQRPVSTSSNSSATSDSTGLDSDSQLKCDVDLPQHDLRPLAVRGPPLGTLRSVQSTLSTWDGEPCPVHHVQVPVGLLLSPPPPPAATLYPLTPMLPVAPPPPPPPPLPPPAVLLPPMLRPRPLVLAAEAAGRPEPLPVRDPKTSLSLSLSPLPPKEGAGPAPRLRCCKGNIVVVWVVLGVVFVGILLAVVLRFVTA